jgi:hypothetical protein
MSIYKSERFNCFDLYSKSLAISKSHDFVIFIDIINEVIAIAVELEQFHRILHLLAEATLIFGAITICLGRAHLSRMLRDNSLLLLRLVDDARDLGYFLIEAKP